MQETHRRCCVDSTAAIDETIVDGKLDPQGIKEKNLEEIMGLILEESSGSNPLHKRRIKLMWVKKASSHSDFFFQLEQH